MAFPLGNILRSFIKGGPLRKILDALRGTRITTPGGREILLDEQPGVYPAGRSPFDSAPAKVDPPQMFGRRR